MEKAKNKISTDIGTAKENVAELQKISQDAAKRMADEATEFIKKNPWVAVLGAAAIGYFLGTTRGSRR